MAWLQASPNVNAREDRYFAPHRKIGMIFQKPNAFPLSIRLTITVPLREYGLRWRSAIDELIKRALRNTNLWESEKQDRLNKRLQPIIIFNKLSRQGRLVHARLTHTAIHS